MPPKITEVSSKRGRCWVYGPLDPARPIEFKPIDWGAWAPRDASLRDAMARTGEIDPYRAYHRMNGGHIFGD